MKGMPLSLAPAKPPITRSLACAFLRGVLCLLLGCLMHQIAFACSVPVFRYGLEHWKADPYRALIVHRGELNAEDQVMVKKLKDASARANVTVQRVDLGRDPGAETDAELAWK